MQISCDTKYDHQEAVRILRSFNLDYESALSAGGKHLLDIDESSMSRNVREDLIHRLTSQACVDVIGEADDDDDRITDQDDQMDDDDDDEDESAEDDDSDDRLPSGDGQ